MKKVLTSRAINKYVYETAFTELLYTCSPLYCMDVKVGLLVREWNRSWKLQKCGFYGVCCVLHRLTKCQMKYFKEPIHQEISWKLLLTDKSDLWDTPWERVNWKRSRWPGWSKAKELEVEKGKHLWIGYWGTMEGQRHTENLSWT